MMVLTYEKDYKFQFSYDLRDIEPVVGPSLSPHPVSQIGMAPAVYRHYSDNKNGRVFMPLGLGKLDNCLRFEKGSYGAIEGYLQLKPPLEPETTKGA